jgi:hypothetical protein
MQSMVPARHFRGWVVVLSLVAMGAGGAAADACETQMLWGSAVGMGDEFGRAMAASGNLVVVGAPLEDGYGAAYVYRLDPDTGAWSQESRLVATDGGSGDEFGTSVATNGSVIVVGAPRNDELAGNAGAAYVFRFVPELGEWQQEAKLTASDAAVADFLGQSVAVTGDVVIAGAYLDDDLGTESGAAYVFQHDSDSGGWLEQAKLVPSDGATRDRFGWSVAASGDVLVVGAYQDDDNGSNSGSAYVFRLDGSMGSWYEEFKLVPADGDAADRFGYSVTVRGNLALVGAYLDNDHGADSGSAYLFRFDSTAGVWIEEQKLAPDDGAATDFFGRAVALGPGVALVGASRDDDAGADAGSAYLYGFDGTAWTLAAKIFATSSQANDRFGYAVTISSDAAVVGAPYADDLGAESGSAYIYDDMHPADCNENGVADGCDIAMGYSLDEDADGVPDECISIPGDLDGDGVVGIGDLQQMMGDWGMCPPDGSACPGDLDGDGVVGILDLLLLLGLI